LGKLVLEFHVRMRSALINQADFQTNGVSTENSIYHCSINTPLVEIKETCPWFFEMRELIGERPNLNPTGLGNSTTEIDLPAVGTEEGSNPDIIAWSDSDVDPNQTKAPEKRKAETSSCDVSDDSCLIKDEETTETDRKRGQVAPRFSSSRPGPATKKLPTKKKTRIEEFADLAQVEELTRQKELEVAKIRAEKGLAETRAKLELKKERLRAQREKNQQRARIAELRLIHEHELRLQQYGQRANIPNVPLASPSSNPLINPPFNLSGSQQPAELDNHSTAFSSPHPSLGTFHSSRETSIPLAGVDDDQSGIIPGKFGFTFNN
jgi:hypothetical protein